MLPCAARKLCSRSCVLTVLVTLLLVVQAQEMDYMQWKPIQWYVAGNITFGTGVSKLDGHGKNIPASWGGPKWKYSNQEPIYEIKDGPIDRGLEVSGDSVKWQEASRSVADEDLGDIPQTWATGGNSGDPIKAESKAEEEQSRKKKKKLLKKFALPLLILYKIKFLMLIPVLVTALVLLSGSSGFAGFFFALFATMMAHGKEH